MERVQITIPRKQICEECDGTGARSPKDIHVCSSCDGRGVRLVRHQLGPGMFQQVQMQCQQCGGHGKTIKKLCPVCHGHRIVQSNAELNLVVDRGLPEGAEVVFQGEADESPDFAAGDVVVRVRTRKAKGGFVRKEANLYWKETISVQEALLGFERTVRGLDGHEIVLKREGVTQPGEQPAWHGLITIRGDELTGICVRTCRVRASDRGRGAPGVPRVGPWAPLCRVQRRPPAGALAEAQVG